MATRPNPYVKKDPGDIMLAADWNEMQVQTREELRGHRHTGGADAEPIARGGIAPGAVDGSRIDPAADVTVKTLTASGNLTVNGDLRVKGKEILGDIAALLATVKGLQGDKLNRAGDTVAGTLSIQQDLTVQGSLKIATGKVGIGTNAPTHKFHVLAEDAVGLFESTGGNACLRLSTKEGIDNRVEIANRPGGRLGLWTSGGGEVLNITKGGNVGINLTDPNAKLVVAGEFIRKIVFATGLGPVEEVDNGQIVSRVLKFTKYHASTAVRIAYCDNLRVNGNNVAARWEIRVDGAAPPGGAICQDKYGSSGNFHEPATIFGYAQGLAAGEHTISVWVGPVPESGIGISDANTGWRASRWTLEAQEVWV